MAQLLKKKVKIEEKNKKNDSLIEKEKVNLEKKKKQVQLEKSILQD
jgi:hypothetical protein